MAKKGAKEVLVTGATGHQGGAVLRSLREKGIPVRALTRNPDKPEVRALVGHGTEVVRGDLDDKASLTRALEGVDSVYSVQEATEDPESEVRRGVTLIEAATRQRLSLFVYSSVGSADRNTGIPHFDSKARIEERLRASGLPWVILRPVFFMENWLRMREQIEEGALAMPIKPDIIGIYSDTERH